MKITLSLSLALIACLTQTGYASNPIPAFSHWMLMLDKPQYKAFYTSPKNITNDPLDWTVWHKVDFKSPQSTIANGLGSVVMQLEIRCKTHQVALLRKIEYSVGGKLANDDDISPDKVQFIDYYDKSQAKLSQNELVVNLALVDDDSTCLKGE